MTTVIAICAMAVLLALIAAVTVLAWIGKIDGAAAIVFYSSLSFAGIVSGAQHVTTMRTIQAMRQ